MPSDPCEPAVDALPLTPCVGVCRLDEHGFCIGCQRTGEEIARWRNMGDDERMHLMRAVLPLRKGSQ